MYEVLTVLAQAESYTYAIWEKVHKRVRHGGVAEIGSLLERMIDNGLIEEAKEPLIDASLDSEPIQLYSITSQGRSAFHAERTRQARIAADTPKPAPQPNLPDAATEIIN
jgi:DNA-binding PadR family transcriptional regulator